jgi:hypothetical protein
MSSGLERWKSEAERLWSAPSLDYVQAARLTAEIAGQDAKAFLQQTAAQALPSLRKACEKKADRMTRALARRRFGAVRDALHTLTAPRFGKRGDAGNLTPEDHYRRLLGLPLGRRLFGPEINEAYKRVAKTAHPDAGGSERAFLEISAARDALMKQL